MTEKAPTKTVFEREWDRIMTDDLDGTDGKPKIRPIYVNRNLGIMAVLSAFPKLTGEIVVAPAKGTPGQPMKWERQPLPRLQELNIVCMSMLQLLGRRFDSNTDTVFDRNVMHIEGYGINDHAHAVHFPVSRGLSIRLHQDQLAELKDSARLDNLHDRLTLSTQQTEYIDNTLYWQNEARRGFVFDSTLPSR